MLFVLIGLYYNPKPSRLKLICSPTKHSVKDVSDSNFSGVTNQLPYKLTSRTILRYIRILLNYQGGNLLQQQ